MGRLSPPIVAGATDAPRSRVTGRGAPHVEVVGVSKRFGGVRALRDVTLQIGEGTVHALVGENGAGKSTLGKVVSGLHRPDAGELRIFGQPVALRTPREALAHGITTIAQEISLVPDRTVVENVFLGIERARGGIVDRRRLAERYEALCEDVGFGLPAEARVSELRLADQQKAEILRAVARDARLVVMDEPTATLTGDEVERLLGIVRALRDRGTTVIYVSHVLEEVLSIADTVTVMRDGATVRTAPASDESPASLIRSMLGRSLDATFPPKPEVPPAAPIAFAVNGLRTAMLDDVSLDVRAGEIVGLAGLVGSGRTEIARAIFGADRRLAGTIQVDGRPIDVRSPRDAVRAGIALVPESRKTQGLVLGRSAIENVTLPYPRDVAVAGVLRQRSERRKVEALLERLEIDSDRWRAPVEHLSGGNQQRVLFAKWLFRTPRVLLVDEPTRGVDVGSKLAIYELLHAVAAQGTAVLLISSEIEELVGLAHRIAVMRGGAVVARVAGNDMTSARITAAAFGAADALPSQEGRVTR